MSNPSIIRENLKVYLFRHGQTYYNKEDNLTCWKDSRLTPLRKNKQRQLRKN